MTAFAIMLSTILITYWLMKICVELENIKDKL
jgi:hypothetical protein